jgi:D-alanyl-D-alanine carboxypeptidase/D-alanyl-D-alanine-endopeptidase (penicillin-binding protein 4)
MNKTMMAPRAAIVILAIGTITPAWAQSAPTKTTQALPLQQRVEARLAEIGPGTRFGLVVTDEAGRELIAIAPDARFVPASNTKMFSTAAAFATLSALDQPDAASGAAVRIEPAGRGAADVVLEGRGDARLSGAADCTVDCLSTLADAVAAKTRVVRDVVGDDSLYPDQRWGGGMAWNNIGTRSGTAASALTIDDNELPMLVTAAAPGEAPKVEIAPYFAVENRAVTAASGKTDLSFSREPNGQILRLTGTIAAGAERETIRLGIDDPAHYAAWQLKRMLQARGVRVTGKVDVRHRPTTAADDPKTRNGAPAARLPRAESLASVVPAPLIEDLTHTNKVSQNLHAELILRRVGILQGTGSAADGIAVVRDMLTQAGVPRTAYDFSDGSGMSTYNRVAPRGMVIFLNWIAKQPWGAAFRATLPIAGVDGTLSKRFKGNLLEGKLFGKTGTLNAASAVSGYMIGKSGRTLTFSIYANDMPQGVGATGTMDAALEMIAAEN